MFRSPSILKWIYPSLTWRMETEEKIIYLTFDDGPIPGPTEFVVEELKKYNAKATFFCIGDNMKKYPLILKKISDDGHRIGNHTFHHMNGWKNDVKTYLRDIELCDEMNGAPLKLFRPPYGRIKRAQIKALNEKEIIMWDVLSHDYLRRMSAERCLAGSVKATRPGSIVVFHDSLKAEKNMMYALPRFLNHFQTLGFRFESIQDLK